MAKVTGTAAALPAAALEGWAAGEEDYDVGASTGILTLDGISSFLGPWPILPQFPGLDAPVIIPECRMLIGLANPFWGARPRNLARHCPLSYQ